MKRIGILILVAVLVFIMAACSGNGNGENNAGNTGGNTADTGAQNENGQAVDDAPAEEKDEEKENVKLTFYQFLNMSDQVEAAIAKFEAINPHIDVESIELVPGGNSLDNLKKLDVLMAAGEPVDVITMPNIDEIVKRAANGVLEPLNGFYEKDGIVPKDEYIINPTYEGNYYAQHFTSSFWFVMLNKDHLDEVGLEVPEMGWTWDDYRDYAKKLTKGSGNDKRYGAYFHTWGEFANPILYTERPHPYMKDENTPIFEDPSFDYWFQLRKDMEQVDQSVKPLSDVIGAKLNYRNEFFSEAASMEFIGSWMLASIGDTEKYGHDFKTALAPLPRSSEQVQEGLTEVGGNFLSISKNSKHKEEAYQFIRFMTTEGYKGFGLPGWKKADGEADINELVAGKEAYYDKESIIHTLFDDRVTTLESDITVSYGSELKKVLENGLAKFLLDGVSIEDTKQTMMEEALKIMEQNSN